MPPFSLTVNGRTQRIDADGQLPLLWALRDHLHLFGTKFGCGIGVCGACTILEGTRAVRSCMVALQAAEGRSYTTIEGLSANGSHPCQQAWLDEDVAQCGFCQPGMIMEAVALLDEHAHPSDTDIDRAFAQHVCRCGTYVRIRRAVRRAEGAATR